MWNLLWGSALPGSCVLRGALWCQLPMQMEEQGGGSSLFCFHLLCFLLLRHSCALNTHPTHTITMAPSFKVLEMYIALLGGQRQGLACDSSLVTLRSVERRVDHVSYV